MASVGMDMDVYRLEIYGTLWNIMELFPMLTQEWPPES